MQLGDCVINTSFPLLVNKTKKLPAIVCVQRKAPKCVPTDQDLMNSNFDSFGNAVGGTTNKITSMFEVQSNFPKGSREYNILDYRIKCGQLYQQNAIDKTKGIEAKPMPMSWYNWNVNSLFPKKKKIGNSDDCSGNVITDIAYLTRTSKQKKKMWLNRLILADKKPYFMQYVYPAERTDYLNYIKKNNEKCLMRFRITLDELLHKDSYTDEEHAFLEYYYRRLPLGTGPCTINKICWKIESMFDSAKFDNHSNFDFSILKSSSEYSKDTYNKIKKQYEQYKKDVQYFMQYAKSERLKSEERQAQKYILKEGFKEKCFKICPNENELCNIVLDLCYTNSNNSKQFAWDMCGEVFIKNLLRRNNYKITYPEADENGDIEFAGMRFSMKETEINVEINMEDECECPSF